MRDGVLLVLPHCCAQRQSEFGVLQYIDTVVDVGDAFALWRLVKEFHIFSPCCSRCSPGFWTLFPEPLVSGSHLPLCVATVHGCSWTNFVNFLREKWTRISLQFTIGYFGIISTSSIWQSPRASVYVAFGRI